MTALWVQLFTGGYNRSSAGSHDWHWSRAWHSIAQVLSGIQAPGLAWLPTPPPPPAPHHAVSLLARPIACVARMSDAGVSFPGGEGQTSSSESQAGTKPESTRFPQSQSLSHWNTFCRCLLLSPNQALGLALLNSEPGFYLILKIWKP